jgi:hypothetical protein
LQDKHGLAGSQPMQTPSPDGEKQKFSIAQRLITFCFACHALCVVNPVKEIFCFSGC